MLTLSVLLAACAAPQPGPLSADLADWAERGKDMVWSHTTPDPPPDMPLERFEVCGDFGIAFFDSSDHRLFISDGADGFLDDDLLWTAGDLSQPPENADGGFIPSPQDPTVNPYRTEHGPCEVVFEQIESSSI
jgi:hypothetical protein